MSWLDLIFLSVIQGVAEFLPISSSGHLVVFEAILGISSNQTDLNIALHFGTLLSILVFYRKRIVELFQSDRRVIPLLIVGTIPAVIIGLTMKTLFEEQLESALLAGIMLPLTGVVLLWSSRAKPGDKVYTEMSYVHALIIGTFQAAAILPGLSRSGFTISAGLLLGQKKSSAATFSFLLAIPAILGATVLELKDVISGEVAPGDLLKLGVGAAIAFVVGWISLTWLMRLLEKGRLHWFAYWCIPFGLLVFAWQLYVIYGPGAE